MTVTSAHRWASGALVASSALAVVLSGAIDPYASGLVLMGITGGLAFPPVSEPDRRRRLLAGGIGLGGFGAGTALWLSGGPLLAALSLGLLGALVARLLVRWTARDERWIELLAFFVLIAAAGLNADLSFAVCFAAFVVFAAVERILLHLRLEGLVKEVRGPWVAGAVGVATATLVVGLAVFLALPRARGSLLPGGISAGLSLTGFSETVALGDYGVILRDPSIVMRVRLSDLQYAAENAPPLYWRGMSFDHYAAGRWSRVAPALAPVLVEEEGPIVRLRLIGNAGARDLRGAEVLRQEILLEPLGTDLVFAAAQPLAFEFDRSMSARLLRARRLGEEVRVRRRGGIAYAAYSQPDAGSLQAEVRNDGALPPWLLPYLQLPPDLPPRVRRLAHQIVEGRGDVAGRVRAVRDFLRERYQYTLELHAPPPGRDPLDFFLFDRREGHCEYFSSALVILLRSLGIPARNVNGFLGGDWNTFGEYLAVRAAHAHSWAEVWLGERGWVTVDPTPPAAVGAAGGRTRRMGVMVGLADAMRLAWLEWVVAYDLQKQVEILQGTGRWLRAGGIAVDRAVRPLSRVRRRHAVFVLAGGVFLALALMLLRRRKWERGAGATTRHPVARAYREGVRALARRGLRPRPDETPGEFVRRVEAGFPRAAPPLRELTSLYYRARYGPAVGTERLGPPARELARRVRIGVSEDARRARERRPRWSSNRR